MRNIWRKIRTHFRPRWEDIERFDENWKDRIKSMTIMLPSDVISIIDLGAGRMWLRDYLNPDIEYFPVDYRKRDKSTIVCDFNKYEFPKITASVAFCSGIIEYLDDPQWFFQQTNINTSYLILSYCSLDFFPTQSERKENGWRNHMTLEELTLLIKNQGYTLLEQQFVTNSLLLFQRYEDINN